MTSFDDAPPSQFFVSTEKALLDVPFVLAELKKTYWGGWLTLSTVLTAIDNSLCFGLYLREHGLHKQVGFARVITDYATFAWVCDVFVAKPYQQQGQGKFLLRVLLTHPDVKHRSCLLCTQDAQKLYKKFGFSEMTAMKRQGSSPDAPADHS